jgi:hypothetical protein
MQLKHSLIRGNKTALEHEALTFARQALVDWVVNVQGEQNSVVLTIQIEHATTQDELLKVLDQVCTALQDQQSTHEITAQRKRIVDALKIERPVVAVRR